MLSHSNGVPAGMRGEVHTDNQGLWTQSSLQVPFSIRTLISNQSFGFSLNTLSSSALEFSSFVSLLPPPSFPRFCKFGLFSLFSFHQKCHQLREIGPATLLYVGLSIMFISFPGLFLCAIFPSFLISVLVLLNVLFPPSTCPHPP